MSDETPVLHVDARLRIAGLRPHVSPTPPDEVLALVDEARHAGMCGTRTVVATTDLRWRHPICAVVAPHLGYHRALSGDLWSQDAADLERVATRFLAERNAARALAAELRHTLERIASRNDPTDAEWQAGWARGYVPTHSTKGAAIAAGALARTDPTGTD